MGSGRFGVGTTRGNDRYFSPLCSVDDVDKEMHDYCTKRNQRDGQIRERNER